MPFKQKEQEQIIQQQTSIPEKVEVKEERANPIILENTFSSLLDNLYIDISKKEKVDSGFSTSAVAKHLHSILDSF